MKSFLNKIALLAIAISFVNLSQAAAGPTPKPGGPGEETKRSAEFKLLSDLENAIISHPGSSKTNLENFSVALKNVLDNEKQIKEKGTGGSKSLFDAIMDTKPEAFEHEFASLKSLKRIFDELQPSITNKSPAIASFMTWISQGINSGVDASGQPLLSYALFTNKPDAALELLRLGAVDKPNRGGRKPSYYLGIGTGAPASKITDEAKRKEIAGKLGV